MARTSVDIWADRLSMQENTKTDVPALNATELLLEAILALRDSIDALNNKTEVGNANGIKVDVVSSVPVPLT